MKLRKFLLLLTSTLGIGLGGVKASVALEHKAPPHRHTTTVFAEAKNLICYMRTQGGQTVDLTSLCSKEVRIDIRVDDVIAMDGVIYGTVSNPTGKKLTAVRVKYQLLDKDSNVEWRTVNTDPTTLGPRETATFSLPRSSDRDIGDEFYADGSVTP